MVGVRKPDARIFGITCQRLGVRADECVFLDDIGAAKSLGFSVCYVGSGRLSALQAAISAPRASSACERSRSAAPQFVHPRAVILLILQVAMADEGAAALQELQSTLGRDLQLQLPAAAATSAAGAAAPIDRRRPSKSQQQLQPQRAAGGVAYDSAVVFGPVRELQAKL